MNQNKIFSKEAKLAQSTKLLSFSIRRNYDRPGYFKWYQHIIHSSKPNWDDWFIVRGSFIFSMMFRSIQPRLNMISAFYNFLKNAYCLLLSFRNSKNIFSTNIEDKNQPKWPNVIFDKANKLNQFFAANALLFNTCRTVNNSVNITVLFSAPKQGADFTLWFMEQIVLRKICISKTALIYSINAKSPLCVPK